MWVCRGTTRKRHRPIWWVGCSCRFADRTFPSRTKYWAPSSSNDTIKFYTIWISLSSINNILARLRCGYRKDLIALEFHTNQFQDAWRDQMNFRQSLKRQKLNSFGVLAKKPLKLIRQSYERSAKIWVSVLAWPVWYWVKIYISFWAKHRVHDCPVEHCGRGGLRNFRYYEET